MTKIINVALIF